MSPLPSEPCPNDETLARFMAGGLAPAEEALLRAHLEACERCRAHVEAPYAATRLGAPGNARAAVGFRVGDMFAGKYRIDGVLGAGGMGTVLEARHVELDRTVAIKVMHADLALDPESARRFSREARAAAALKSPHAVRILDIDRLSDTSLPFIVMEHLEGADLGTVLAREGAIPYARAVDWILQAMKAVAEAHERGFVHRDLKPQNLFLTRDSVVKVVDFGLAKTPRIAVGPGSASGTQNNVMMGSPHYMSPEQIRSARHVDERADIWALGATLHHLVVGQPPFVGANLYVLCAQILNEEALPLRRLRPDVPTSLEAVVQTCLHKNAALRYGSCAELEAALRAAMAEPRGQTPPPAARRNTEPPDPGDATTETSPVRTVKMPVAAEPATEKMGREKP